MYMAIKERIIKSVFFFSCFRFKNVWFFFWVWEV